MEGGATQGRPTSQFEWLQRMEGDAMESSDSEAGGDGVGASPYQKGDAAARRVSPQAPAKPPTPGVTLVVRAGGGGGRRVRRTWAAFGQLF